MESSDLLERCYPGARSKSKRHILSCALVLFNEKGMEATTIDLIRAESQSSVGSIYHHFGNKEGVAAALYTAALEDQSRLRNDSLASVKTLREAVQALIFSYVDWVAAHPDWARFMFKARAYLSSSEHAQALNHANILRNSAFKTLLDQLEDAQGLRVYPGELIPSLVIGAAENYCRAWLSGRVKKSPALYREQLAQAAWLSLKV